MFAPSVDPFDLTNTVIAVFSILNHAYGLANDRPPRWCVTSAPRVACRGRPLVRRDRHRRRPAGLGGHRHVRCSSSPAARSSWRSGWSPPATRSPPSSPGCCSTPGTCRSASPSPTSSAPAGGRLVGSHLMIDESVAFALAQPDPARRRRAYWLTGVLLFVAWNIGTVLGVLLGGVVGDPDRARPRRGLPGRPDRADPAVAARPGHPAGGAGSARRSPYCSTPVLPAGLPVLLALGGLGVPRRCPGGDRRSGRCWIAVIAGAGRRHLRASGWPACCCATGSSCPAAAAPAAAVGGGGAARRAGRHRGADRDRCLRRGGASGRACWSGAVVWPGGELPFVLVVGRRGRATAAPARASP